MKIIDPHIDLADFYTLNKWGVREFFKEDSPAWVTLPKLQKCGIEIIGLTLYFDESFKKTSFYDGVKSFYKFYRQLTQQSDKFVQILSKDDIINKADNKIGYFFSIEGFECFRDPEDFDEFYDLGVRSFGFTWSFDNQYACGRHSKLDNGISDLGNKVIRKMINKKSLIVDIAHLSEKSVVDIERFWPGMILTTHGNCREVYQTIHNLADREIEIIVERGGVVSLFPLTEDTGKKGNFDELYKHLDYIASKWGLEYVAFSSDIYPLPEYPFLNSAKDISITKDWYDYLLTRLKPEEVEKVMWGNWERVIREAL